MNNDSDFFIESSLGSGNYLNYSDKNNDLSISNFQSVRGIGEPFIGIDTGTKLSSLYDGYLAGSIWDCPRDDQPYQVDDYIYSNYSNGQTIGHLNDRGLNFLSNFFTDTTSIFPHNKVGNSGVMNKQGCITTGIESDKLVNFGLTENQEVGLGCESLIGSDFSMFGSSNLGTGYLSKSAAQVDFWNTKEVDDSQFIGDCIYFDSPTDRFPHLLADGDLNDFSHLLDDPVSALQNDGVGLEIGENNISGIIDTEINENINFGLELGAFKGSEVLNINSNFGLANYFENTANFPKHNLISGKDLFTQDLDKNRQIDIKSYDYDENFLEELSKIDKKLTEIYKGAIEVNKEKISDYKRHVANGFRELISNTIRCLLPQDDNIVDWFIKTNRKQLLINRDDKLVLTRKAKLIYIFRHRSKRERKLVEDEGKCINRLYNILNGPTHNLTTNISGELLDNYIQKVKNSLKTLILLYNN